MKEYVIYFEAFGKKMKTSKIAENENEAKEMVLDGIKFIHVDCPKNAFNAAVDMMDDILNHLNKKK